MDVLVDELVPGAILAEDVLGRSTRPIIPKKTVLTEQHIYFLQKFLVKKVIIEPRLADGTIFQSK